MLDPSQYFPMSSAGMPTLYRYCAGRYHPVHIYDYLTDWRYSTAGKLGFGSFSTV